MYHIAKVFFYLAVTLGNHFFREKEGQGGRRNEEEGGTRRKEGRGGRREEESEKMKKFLKNEK